MNKCREINDIEIWNSQQMSFIIWKVSYIFPVSVLQRRICVADNVIEQANLENMGAAFVILFLAVLQAEMLLLPV